MGITGIGTLFRDYRQYCDLVDEALAALHSPLMNGLPMAGMVRQLIGDGRLYYVKNPDHMLLFSTHEGYCKLYYAAREDALLAIPASDIPVVADQVRLDGRSYPRYDAMMERSAFRLDRVNVGMERKLDGSLKRELYVRDALPDTITVGLAMPGELFKLCKLLRGAFDSILDELPPREELRRIIENGHVFVIRDRERIAAAIIRIPKGNAAMMHWIVVDTKYRKLNLSGLLAFAGDLDSQRRGYRKVVIWVDERAGRWIQIIQSRGYRRTGQKLYTYMFYPHQAEGLTAAK